MASPASVARPFLLPCSSTFVPFSSDLSSSAASSSLSSPTCFSALPSAAASSTPDDIVPPFLLTQIRDITLPPHSRAEALLIFQAALAEYAQEAPLLFQAHLKPLLQFLLDLLRDADGDKESDGGDGMESGEGLQKEEKRKTRSSTGKRIEISKEAHANKPDNSSDTKKDSNDSPEQDHGDDEDILSLATLQCLHLVLDAGKHHLANHLHTLLPPLLLHHLLLPTHTSTILLLLTTLSQHVELSFLLPPLLHLHAFTHPSPLARAAALGVMCTGLAVMTTAASTNVAVGLSPQQLLMLALEGAQEEEEEVREAGREAVRVVYRLFYSTEAKEEEGETEEGEGVFLPFVQKQGGQALEADVRRWLFVKKEVEEKKKGEEEAEEKEQQQQQQQGETQEEGDVEQVQKVELEAPPSPSPAASFFDRAKLFSRRQVSGRSLIPRPASSTTPQPSVPDVPPPSPSSISSIPTSPSSSLPPSSPAPLPPPRRRPPPPTPPRSPMREKGLVQWDDDDEEPDEEQQKEMANTILIAPFSFPLPQSHQQHQQKQQQRCLPRHHPIASPPRYPLQGKGLVEWRDDDEENGGDDEARLAATAIVTHSPPSPPPASPPPPPSFRSRLPRPSRSSSSSNLPQSSCALPPSPLSPVLVEYLSPADIHPLPQPSHALPLLLDSLPTADWPESFHTLTTARCFALRHPDLLLALPPVQLQLLLRQVLRQVNNLRSAVAKNALLALADLWAGLASSSLSSSSSPSRVLSPSKSSSTEITTQRLMEGELAAIAPVLLRRFCDTSGFLVEAAESALDAVILYTPDTTRVLLAFLPLASHKSPAGRSKVASLVLRCLLVLTSAAAASPSGAVTAAGGGASPRKQKTKIPTPTTTMMMSRKHSGTSGGGVLSKDLRERLESATQQWMKDPNGETRAEGRKVAAVLPVLV